MSLKIRYTIERGGTERTLLGSQPIPKGWRVKEIIRPKRRVEADRPANPLIAGEDPVLAELVFKYRAGSIPDLLDLGRKKFGSNVSVEGLVQLIKARGL